MIRFFSAAKKPAPDDWCLVHSRPGSPPEIAPQSHGWWARRSSLGKLPEGEFLGETDSGFLWAIETDSPAAGTWTSLRQVLAEASPDQAKSAIRAVELASWRAQSRFCGSCGSPMRPAVDLVARECTGCGTQAWPRLNPAVIMLVHRGDEILLARHAAHARPGVKPIFTTLAGFVEAGETLEEAVAREVAEETGVVVGQPHYIGSQSWPFPASLMVGFHVPWVSGEPKPDGNEIWEAGWFRQDALPDLPGPPTIARRLIDLYWTRRLK